MRRPLVLGKEASADVLRSSECHRWAGGCGMETVWRGAPSLVGGRVVVTGLDVDRRRRTHRWVGGCGVVGVPSTALVGGTL